MNKSMQSMLVAAVILLSVYVVRDAMSQQPATPTASPSAAQTATTPAAPEVTLDKLSEDLELLMKWLGEPKSKRDNLHDMNVRRFNDMDKRFDKIERELRTMRQQIDRIESRR